MPRARPLALALALAFVLGPAGAPPAEAKAAEVAWEYVVDLTRAAEGEAEVELHIRGAEGSITTMRFDARDSEYDVSDLAGATETEDDVYELAIASPEEVVRYTVDVRRPAPGKSDEYASWLDAKGGVLKAEAFALRYEYSFYCGTRIDEGEKCPRDESPRFTTTMRFALPAGWTVEGPWAAGESEGEFALPAGETLPRGFFAVGPLKVAERTVEGRTYRFAELGGGLEDVSERELFDYLAAATPYYASVYGDAVGDIVFVVAAGDPMFKGGLAGHDSLYVHHDVDLRTLAHEYAHVWQAFNGKAVPGEATIWVNEGDAEYHGTLSLFATGDWSLAKVNDFFEDAYKARTESGAKAPLTTGVYGHDDVIAYKKGVVTMAWLDDAVKQNSDGTKSLSDVLKALNALYGPDADGKTRVDPLENEEVLATLNDVVQRDFTDLWERYVLGNEWPSLRPVVANEELALVAVEFTPEAATPGEEVVARIVAENRGLTDVARTLPVTLDGEEIGTVEFDLPSERRTGDATVAFTAPDAGEHRFKVGYLTTTFRSLEPARFAVDKISVVPTNPRAGGAASVLVYVANAGEAAAPTKVRLSLDGAPLGEKPVVVAGGTSASASWDVLFPVAGPAELAAEILHDGPAGANDTALLQVDVRVADRDLDGVPDDVDAFPDNPRVSEAGALGSVQDKVPSVGTLVVALALAGVALATRRRGR